ncbi:MAG TPA: hypothetical protein VD738_07975, partial [Nitrospira sp.]|nr:hypothetical protein [Nitrospira sp.]
MIRYRPGLLLLSSLGICLSSLLFVERDAPAAVTDSPGLRILEEIQTVITELAEQAKPSVVNLFPVQSQSRL